MNIKRLSLGAIAVIAPISTVVSCGINKPSEDDIKIKNQLESNKTYDLIEERWQKQVLDMNNVAFDVVINTTAHTSNWDDANMATIRDSYDFFMQTQVNADQTYLHHIAQQIMTMPNFKEQFIDGTNKTAKTVLTEWGLLHPRNKQGIYNDGKKEWTLKEITKVAKAFIFKNVESVRKAVYKQAVSYLFLSKGVTKADYKKTNMQEWDKYSDAQEMITDTADFGLINEAISQHLFAKWSLTSSSTNLWPTTFTAGTKYEISAADAKAHLLAPAKGAASNLFSESNYGDKHAHSNTTENALYGTDSDKLAGFKGVVALPTGKDLLSFTANNLKSATDIDSWNGWEQKNEFFELGATKIPLYSDKNNKEASVTKIFGFMPIIKNNTTTKKDELTFEGSYFDSTTKPENRKFLIFNLIKSDSVYSKAVSYYAKREKDPIQVEIAIDSVKKLAIDHGFKFIKE